jgi:hypothetical protein
LPGARTARYRSPGRFRFRFHGRTSGRGMISLISCYEGAATLPEGSP